MGREARRNGSAARSAGFGHRKPARVTIGQLRRQRHAEMRSHLAGLVASNMMHKMAVAQAQEEEQRAAERLAAQMGLGGAVTLVDG